MTSSTNTAGHPDVAEISDLTEGLLPVSRTADVRQHLDECELCADVQASLEEIRGLLGTLPSSPRMPDDVSDRIDAALAAEALLQATAPEAVNDGPAPAESAHVSRETSPTADRPTGHARSATTGPGRKDRKRNGRRRAAVLGAVFTVAALGLGSVLFSALDDGKSTDTGRGKATTSADTFSASGLEKEVSDLLAGKSANSGSKAPHTSMGAENVPGSGDPRILMTPEVPPCIQKGIHSTGTPLATDNGIYKGTEALLVVLPDPSDSTRVTAYIMDASCVKNAPTGTAKILLKHSYARS